MTAYLVSKDINEDRRYEQGEVLTDPFDDATRDILVSRGYLTIVPSDYKGADSRTSTASADGSEAEQTPAEPTGPVEATPPAPSPSEPASAPSTESQPATDSGNSDLPKIVDLSKVEADPNAPQPEEPEPAPETTKPSEPDKPEA